MPFTLAVVAPQEQTVLHTAVLSIADPRGNWEYGWKLICELAGMDPAIYKAPFRARDLKTDPGAQPGLPGPT